MIRRLDQGEAGTAAELAAMLWPGHSRDELERELADCLSSGRAAVFLLYEEGEPAGFAQCQLRFDYVEGASHSPVGYLEGIFVKEKYRKKGRGRLLLSACQSWAEEMGAREFASDCELENEESLAFHLKSGFEIANRIICFIKKK